MKPLIAFAFAFWLLSNLSVLAGTGKTTADLRKKPAISMDAARQVALDKRPGTVISEVVEKKNGVLRYSFDIKTLEGTREVGINADTGKVIKDKIETPQDEAQKKQPDARPKSKDRSW